VVIENGTVKTSDYVLLTPTQESEFSHIMQYSTSSSLGSSGAYIELRDAMSDTTSRFYLTDTGYATGTLYIDGQAYYAKNVTRADSSQDYYFTWGAGSSSGNVGNKITVFPLVKTSKGAWITLVPGNTTDGAFYQLASIRPANSGIPTDNTTGWRTYEVPGGDILVQNGGARVRINCAGTDTNVGHFDYGQNASACLVGRMFYNVTTRNVSANYTSFSIAPSAVSVQYPAVVLREEKAKDNSASATEYQDYVVVTVADGSGSGVDLTVQAPVGGFLTSALQTSAALQSDNSVTNYIDRYGTMVKYDTDSQGLVEITYPDDQAIATIAIGDNPAFGAGTSNQVAVKITSPVAKLASEVSPTAPSADLILVGGPCANSLVAKLLGAGSCDSWNYTTGIIKEVTGGFTDGSRALIVAGTTASDTRNLAKMLIQGTLSYTA
jgi:hypothetical protein